MIRINLLGGPRPKKGGRGGGGGDDAGGATGPSGIVFLVLGLVIGVGVAGGLYWQQLKTANALEAESQKLDKEASDLRGAKSKVEQLTKEKDELTSRKKAIDELVSNHVGPVSLMDNIGNVVNASDAVWLDSMTDAGGSVTMDGNALTTTAVANFMTRLKASGYFKNVDIKDASENNADSIHTFKFSLNCEKATVQAAAPAGGKDTPAAAPAAKPGPAPAKS